MLWQSLFPKSNFNKQVRGKYLKKPIFKNNMNRRQYLKQSGLLLGGLLSAPTLSAMSRFGQSQTTSRSSIAFTQTQSTVIAEIAELIIPKTNTPGALDAGVPDFVQMMIKDCYKTAEQQSFMEGLNALEKENFSSLSAAAKTERLKKLEADTNVEMAGRNVKQTKLGDNLDVETMSASAKGLPFWRLIKELTLLGYYTSEPGISSNFEYVPVPGKFEPIKIKPGQKDFVY